MKRVIWETSFADFLRTGCLGPLRCGLTKVDVELAIGRPRSSKDIEDYPGGRACWCYFPVEVRFCGESIDDIGIGFAWWDGMFPDWWRPKGFYPAKDTRMTAIRAFLSENRIPFELGKDGRMLRTGAGVWIFPTTEKEDTIMTASKECGGRDSFFDQRFRNSQERRVYGDIPSAEIKP